MPKKLKLSKELLIILLLILFLPSANARPLPYLIDNNSLIVDGLFYYDNNTPQLKLPNILSTTQNGFNYEIVGGIYKSYYSNNINKDDAFNFEYDNTNVSFIPKSIYLQSNPQNATKSQSVTASINGLKITYPSMFGVGIDYKLSYSDTLIKEELILAQNPYPLALDSDTFIFKHRFNYSSLNAYVNGAVWDKTAQSTTEPIIFKNTLNETYFKFLKPYAIDASGNKIDLTYDISSNKQTGEMNIKLNVPMSFLLNASYPVIIDPPLEQNGGSITLDGINSYTYVNVTNSGIIYVTAYDATGTTGTLTLNVTNDVNVDSTSSINGASRGGRGGNGGTSGSETNAKGLAGESTGAGSNGATVRAYIDTAKWMGSGAGGGGYASSGGAGGNSATGSYGYATGGAGGSAYGTSNGWDIAMGSGAGGGGGDADASNGANGNPGGAMLRINAGGNINIFGTLSFSGGAGGAGGLTAPREGGGGGGASGGGILLNGSTIDLTGATITVTGGSGGAGASSGGAGSGGRYKAFYKGTYTTTGSTISAGSTYSEDTNSAPTVPVTTQHASFHTVGSTTVTWSASTDPNSNPITYTVKVGTTSGGTNVLNYAGDTDTTSNSFNTANSTTYYYSVKACDAWECSAFSTEKSFTQTNSAPTTPSLIQHANFHVKGSTTVNWTASTDGDSDGLTYDVKVYNTTSGVLILNQTKTQNNFSNSFLTANSTSYNYTARANDGYTNSSWAIVKTFTFTNNIPVIQDVTLVPSNATSTSNLSVTINSTDADSDYLNKYYRWYKNGTLNNSWNNKTYLNYTGNFTTGDTIYVIGYTNDSFANSSEVQSNSVIIGSGNSAPLLPGITLSPSSKKYNKTITVSTTSNITDTDSTSVILRIYWYNNSIKEFLVNSTWFSPPNNSSIQFTVPWKTGTTYSVYGQVEDSGNALGQQNLTSTENYSVFTLNTTSPTIVNSTLTTDTLNIGAGNTITAYFDGQGANISSAIVSVERPDATTANWSMTCNAGEIVKCTKLYTSTSDIGTYYIRLFYPLDDSGNSNAISSELSFNTQAIVSSSSSSSGGGGGGGNIIIVNDTSPSIAFKSITDFRSTEEIKQLGECLSESILLPNKCTSGKIVTAVITDVYNFWILASAYIVSFLTVLGLAIASQKPRKYVQDAILYGTITIVILLFLQLLGFNLYVFSYAFRDASPALMSISIGAWSLIISIISDNLSYKKHALI